MQGKTNKNNSIPTRISDFRKNCGAKILRRDIVIYLLQNLEFIINLRKSVSYSVNSGNRVFGDDDTLNLMPLP